MIERANENRRRAKKKTELKELKEPKEPKEKKEPKEPKEAKDPNVLVIKGKRGRKPKVNPEVKPILVEINEIINYPLS